jgi:replication factor C subunit 2/4
MSKSIPWVEKHRPKTLDDVVGNEEAVQRLRALSETGNIPNLILTGPPGIGKTTSLLALCNQLLGDKAKEAVKELNASDERGIEVVRKDIKEFAKKHINLPEGRHKIVLLDESDSMTDAAQQAMRRIMEEYSATTRFVFACNQSEKVIEPIQSRCAIVRFTRVSEEQIAARLVKICEAEGIKVESEGIGALAALSDGDLRTAVNGLQSTYVRYGLITKEYVLKTVDAPNPTAISDIFKYLGSSDFRKALTVLNGLEENGHSPSDIVRSMFSNVRRSTEIKDEKLKLELLKEIGLSQMSVSQGLTSNLQLSGLLARLFKIMNK